MPIGAGGTVFKLTPPAKNQKLIEAIIELVSNSPPDKTEQLAEAVKRLSGAQNALSLTSWAANPRAKNGLTKLVTAWGGVDIPPAELTAMLMAASAAYHRAKAEQEIELVWTGPSSTLIATRKTEQALLQVIDAAESRLFITSFVVHAKVAVADENICFISSANLTGHAMEKNMEAGVLLRGGATPRSLHRHLEALETTHVIVKV